MSLQSIYPVVVALVLPSILTMLFVRNAEIAIILQLASWVIVAWIYEAIPLVVWTPQHAAAVNIRPSAIVKTIAGGVLGIGLAMAIIYALNWYHYAVAIVGAGLLILPIGFLLMSRIGTVLVATIVIVMGIGAAVALGKYREQTAIDDTIEHLKSLREPSA